MTADTRRYVRVIEQSNHVAEKCLNTVQQRLWWPLWVLYDVCGPQTGADGSTSATQELRWVPRPVISLSRTSPSRMKMP